MKSTLCNEILFDPTNVVLNSLPVAPTTVAAAAGDCVGLGRNTTVPAFGLLLNWCTDVRLPGVAALRSCSWVVLVMVLFVTNITSCGKGDNEGDGWSLGLAGIDGDGLGVRNDPGGESIPVKKKTCFITIYLLGGSFSSR